MAAASSVLEKKEVKRYADDTTPLTCTVAGVKPFQSHVVSSLIIITIKFMKHMFQL